MIAGALSGRPHLHVEASKVMLVWQQAHVADAPKALATRDAASARGGAAAARGAAAAGQEKTPAAPRRAKHCPCCSRTWTGRAAGDRPPAYSGSHDSRRAQGRARHLCLPAGCTSGGSDWSGHLTPMSGAPACPPLMSGREAAVTGVPTTRPHCAACPTPCAQWLHAHCARTAGGWSAVGDTRRARRERRTLAVCP